MLLSISHSCVVCGCTCTTVFSTSQNCIFPFDSSLTVCPVPTPPAIWAVGVNYYDSFVELGIDPSTYMYPVAFMENPAAMQNPFDPIVIPKVIGPI